MINLGEFSWQGKHWKGHEHSIYDDYEIILSKKEAEDLAERLKRGPNDKAKKFLKESVAFYEEMKKKLKEFKK